MFRYLRVAILGKHIANTGVANNQRCQSDTCKRHPETGGTGTNNKTTPTANNGAKPINTALYQRTFKKPTEPNTHCPFAARRGHNDKDTGRPFSNAPTSQCKNSCTTVPGNKNTACNKGCRTTSRSNTPNNSAGNWYTSANQKNETLHSGTAPPSHQK